MGSSVGSSQPSPGGVWWGHDVVGVLLKQAAAPMPASKGGRVGLRNFASSESLPGVCPDPQGREPSTRNTCRALLDQTSAQTIGVAGVRAALATALAADRRDRSI